MKILQVGKFYPPQRGGMESTLRDLCRGLSARGHEVVTFVSGGDRAGSAELVDGIRLRRLGRWGTYWSVPFSPAIFGALRAELRGFDPDVVHLHLPHPLAVLALQLARDPTPLMITYHSDIVRQHRLRVLYEPPLRRTLRRARCIHVTSPWLRDESPLLRDFRERCEVVPLGIDVDRFAHAPQALVQRWKERYGPRFLLFVGRLVYYKGIDILLAALRNTALSLLIVGDGPMRRSWEQASRSLGMDNRVHFAGQVDEEDLVALYHAASAFVLPSTHPSETFGLVQLEAMAAGLPVIAARASDGVASVHEDGQSGLLVAPGRPEPLREAILRVWENPQLAANLGRRGRERVRKHYSMQRFQSRMEELLVDAAHPSAP